MNELEKKLIEYFDNTAQGIEKLVNFSAEQVPLIVQEIITWGIYSNLIDILFCSVLLVVVLKIRASCIADIKEDSYTDDEIRFAINGVTLLCTVFLVGNIYCTLFTAVKAYATPRLYVIETLRRMSK